MKYLGELSAEHRKQIDALTEKSLNLYNEMAEVQDILIACTELKESLHEVDERLEIESIESRLPGLRARINDLRLSAIQAGEQAHNLEQSRWRALARQRVDRLLEEKLQKCEKSNT